MPLSLIEIDNLLKVAKESRNNAFVPKSGHKIGAAILSTDGDYFGGCNVESNISGLGVCAERSAIDHAVIHGKYRFEAVLVMDEEKTFPCGACLQYLVWFSQTNNRDIKIIVADTNRKYKIFSLSELLPHKYLSKTKISKIKKYKNKVDADEN